MTRKRQTTATAVRFRPELHAQLAAEAQARDVSINWLVNKAVEDFLPRLIPADEIQWTRAARVSPADEPPPVAETPRDDFGLVCYQGPADEEQT